MKRRHFLKALAAGTVGALLGAQSKLLSGPTRVTSSTWPGVAVFDRRWAHRVPLLTIPGDGPMVTLEPAPGDLVISSYPVKAESVTVYEFVDGQVVFEGGRVHRVVQGPDGTSLAVEP